MEQNESFPAVTEGTIGGALVQTVNARDLHAHLGVGKDFTTWIKDRIAAYAFNENSDFVVFPEIGENPNGGRPPKEYAVTLDMAKELAMVERNEKVGGVRRLESSLHRNIELASSIDRVDDVHVMLTAMPCTTRPPEPR